MLWWRPQPEVWKLKPRQRYCLGINAMEDRNPFPSPVPSPHCVRRWIGVSKTLQSWQSWVALSLILRSHSFVGRMSWVAPNHMDVTVSCKWAMLTFFQMDLQFLWGCRSCFCYCIHVGLHKLSSSMPSGFRLPSASLYMPIPGRKTAGRSKLEACGGVPVGLQPV